MADLDPRQDASEQFEALRRSHVVGVASGVESTILEANGRFLSLLGRTTADLARGLDWLTLLAPDQVRDGATGMQAVGANGEFPFTEREILRADGTRVPVMIGGVMVDPRLHQWVCVVVDLTEHRAAGLRLGDSERRLQERRLEQVRTTVQMLQRSLLPDDLPAVPGAALAARYLTAGPADIGGDWFDAFVLTDGCVALSVGDVAGHGIQSTRAMGELRSAARMAAVTDDHPASVLRALDDYATHLSADLYATALFGVYDPGACELRWASAGHPPPLLVRRDGHARYLSAEPVPPLGTGAGRSRRTRGRDRVGGQTAVTRLEAGDGVLGYTDGLVERRSEPIDVGLGRLRAAAQRFRSDPDHLCDAAIEACLPSTGPTDDVCLLGMVRSP